MNLLLSSKISTRFITMTSPLSVVGTKAPTSFNMELDKFMEGIM